MFNLPNINVNYLQKECKKTLCARISMSKTKVQQNHQKTILFNRDKQKILCGTDLSLYPIEPTHGSQNQFKVVDLKPSLTKETSKKASEYFLIATRKSFVEMIFIVISLLRQVSIIHEKLNIRLLRSIPKPLMIGFEILYYMTYME